MGKVRREAKLNIVSDLISKLDELSSVRMSWDITYHRTHDELYEILSKCLEIYHEIKGSAVEREAVLKMREEVKLFTPNLPSRIRIIPLIVRYVFKCNRQRVFSYARVLEKALIANVHPNNLANWVRSKGDYEDVIATLGVTKSTTNKRIILDKKIQEVDAYLQHLIHIPLGLIPGSELVPVTETDEYTLLIAKTLPNGSYSVLVPVPNSDGFLAETAIKKIAQCLIEHPERELYIKELVGNKNMNSSAINFNELNRDQESDFPDELGHFSFYCEERIDIDNLSDASNDEIAELTVISNDHLGGCYVD